MGVPSRRRQAQDEVAEAARRRLELLGRELDRAGLRRLDDVDRGDPVVDDVHDEDLPAGHDDEADQGQQGHHPGRANEPGTAVGRAALDEGYDAAAAYDPWEQEAGLVFPVGVAGAFRTDTGEEVTAPRTAGPAAAASRVVAAHGARPGRGAHGERAELVAERPLPLPEARVVAPAGRHLRPSGPGLLRRQAGRVTGWLGDQVPETFRGRAWLGPGPALLVVLAVVLAVGVAGFTVMRSGDGGRLVPAAAARTPGSSTAPLVDAAPGASASSGPTATGSATTAGSPSTSGTAPASSGQTVTVDVAGKVRRPGVATLPAGSRVVDAVRRAGGPRGRVDLSSLNLARVLVDGEQILVGVTGAPAGGPGAAGAAAGSVAGAGSPTTGTLVNLNTATLDQLDTLPGVGPVTAQKILDWRTAHGAFSSVDELLEVDGIGEKTLADLAPHATL